MWRYGFMKLLCTSLILLLLLSTGANAQVNTDETFNFNKNLTTLHQDPDQTLKVANYFLKNAPSLLDKSKALYLRSESEKLKGNYAQSIEDLYLAKNLIYKEKEPYVTALILIAIAQRCRTYGMEDVSTTYLNRAENHTDNIENEVDRYIALNKLHQEQADRLFAISNFKEVGSTLSNNPSEMESIRQSVPAMYAETQNKIAFSTLASGDIDPAIHSFQNAQNSVEAFQLENSIIEAVSFYGLAMAYSEEKDYTKAEALLQQALDIKVVEPKVKADILDAMAAVYKELDSTAAYQKYYSESATLSASLLTKERNV